MNVLILVKGLGLGGAERLLVDQALHRDPGTTVSVAYVRPDKDHFAAALRDGGVEVTCLGTGGRRRPWPLVLARHLRESRPDIVHSHSPLPAAVARLVVRAGLAGRGCRTAYTEHNRWSAYRPVTRALNALTLPLEAKAWAVSEEARGSVKPARMRRRVETLHHGIDRDALAAEAERPPDPPPEAGPDGVVVAVHVANRRPEKNHDGMVDAFSAAAQEEPRLHLWLVGQHLDDPALLARIRASSAADRIQVLGYRHDVAALIARADMLVLSSDHEGLPVAVMEALTLGTPIVATAVGGVPEAVTDGVEGLLVPPRDPHALAEAIVQMARDEGLRTRMGVAARQRSAEFDAARAREVQSAAYRQLAAAAGARGR